MTRGVFVTGTDTGCGKTFVAAALIRALRRRGLRVAGFKPVAAGALRRDGELRNDDALALIDASGLDIPYRHVNPYCFEPAIAPHLAAADQGVVVDMRIILKEFNMLCDACEFVLVEGAGGWMVPLGPDLAIRELALALGLPVVLVVGLRLGCLNHALLSELAIRASGARLAGWIATQVDPHMSRVNANVAALRDRLQAPCLGVLPHPDACEPMDRPPPLDLDAL